MNISHWTKNKKRAKECKNVSRFTTCSNKSKLLPNSYPGAYQ